MSVHFVQLSSHIGQAITIHDGDRKYTLKGTLRTVADSGWTGLELTYDSEANPPQRLHYELDATAFTQGRTPNMFTSTTHQVTIIFNLPP